MYRYEFKDFCAVFIVRTLYIVEKVERSINSSERDLLNYIY